MKAIYGILNIINGHQYIGSAKNFYKRKRGHITLLKAKIHHSLYLQNAWNKYGEANFRFIVLEKLLEDSDLLKREQWWIDNSHSEYNICKFAGNSLGIKRSEETKEKIRKANFGLKHPAWRNEIKSRVQGGENHWTKNKKFSEESKKRMSKSQKELYKNGYVSPVKGRKATLHELKAKREKNFVAIIQLSIDGNFIKRWDSAIIVQETLGFYNSNIISCCKGRYKTAHNYKWVYENEYKATCDSN